MYYNSVLKKIDNEIPYLNKLNIEYDNVKLDFLKYDKLNIYNIHNLILNYNKENMVLIKPTVKLSELYNIIISAFSSYELDLTDEATSLLNCLEEGDKVKYNGALSKYHGITRTSFDNKQKINIEFVDMKYKFSITEAWKIKKYDGSAKRLNKFPGLKNNVDEDQKDILEKLFNINRIQNNIIPQTKVIILDQKKFIINSLDKIKINGEKFTNLFPCGYFSSSDKFERIGTDSLQREPTICFVSRIDVARKLLSKKNKVKLLIMNASHFNKLPVGQIEHIINTIEKTNILIEFNNINIDSFSILSKIGMRLFMYKSDDIKKLYHKEKQHIYSDSNLIYKHRKKIYNITHHDKEEYIIRTSQKFKDLKEEIKNNLEKIKNNCAETTEILSFIRIGYYLLFRIIYICYPLEIINLIKTEKNIDIKSRIEKMKELSKYIYFDVNSDNFNLFKNTVKLLDEFKKEIYKVNKKYNKLIGIIDNLSGKTAIIVRRNEEKIIIESHLNKNKYNYVNIIKYSDLTVNQVFDNMIFTGCFFKNDDKTLNIENSKKHIFILYDFEENNLRNCMSYREKNISKIPSIKNLFMDIKKHKKPQMRNLNNDKHVTQRNEEMSEILEELNMKYIQSHQSKYNEDDSENKYIEGTYLIDFFEDYYAYFTKDHIANVLSREDEKIIKTKTKNLREGMELVFSKHNKGDIFQEMINRIEEYNPEIKTLKKQANLWQEALRNYVKNDSVNIQNIKNELSKRGYNRTNITLKHWINDYTQIAPSEYKIIRLIAEITSNERLSRNIDSVIESCKKLRSFHIKLGRYLAKIVVRSYFEEDEKGNNILGFKIKNPSKHLEILTINNIQKSGSKVPYEMINIISEKY